MKRQRQPSLTYKAFSGALWTASGWGLTAIFQVIFGVALARLLGPEVLGIYAAALVLIRFSNVFANIGIGPALVQREEIDSSHVRTGLTLTAAVSLGFAVATWFGASLLASFYRMPQLEQAVRILALVFPLRGLAVIPRALLLRNLDFRRIAAIEAAAYLFGFGIVGVSLAVSGIGLEALVFATVTHATLELVLLSWARPFSVFPRLSLQSARELLGYGGGHTLAGIFGFLAFQGDKLLVGRLLGAASLGLYARGYSLAATSTRLYEKIASTAFFPLLSRVQTDRPRLARGFRRGLTLNALSLLPLSAVLYVIAPELIAALLGAQWLGAIAPFQVLILFGFLRSTAKLCSPLMMAAGRVYQLAALQGIFAAFVLGGTWAGSWWGISGVATGIAFAIVIHSALLLQASLRLTGVSWTDVFKAWRRPVLLALVVGTLSWIAAAVLRHWSSSPFLIVGVILVLVAVVLSSILLFSPRLFLGDEALAALRQLPLFCAFEKKVARRTRDITT